MSLLTLAALSCGAVVIVAAILMTHRALLDLVSFLGLLLTFLAPGLLAYSGLI